jgi:hypothetical protein
MSLYIIAIGGTGSKVAEALVHVAASGLLSVGKVRILFVDPDVANGNLGRATESQQRYAACHSLMRGEKDSYEQHSSKDRIFWLQTKIELSNPSYWSPVHEEFNNRTLGDLFDYDSYREGVHEIKSLFDVLFTAQERKIPLDLGFRGRPAIGAAVMSHLALDSQPWLSLLEEVKKEAKDKDKPTIFLCGSAFGGTGASGFPTLGRLIHEYLFKNGCREDVKVGGALLLPYFDFTIPQKIAKDSNELYADPDRFLLNTEAALRYYQVEAEGIFNNIYLLGSPQLSSIPEKEFGLGSNAQKNESHFIELYAALAAEHFLLNNSEEMGKAVLMSRSSPNELTWRDFTKDVEEKIKTTARFAYVWTTVIAPLLRTLCGKPFKDNLKYTPWLKHFFGERSLNANDLPTLEQEFEKIQPITDWCDNYLAWLFSIQSFASSSTQIRLFRPGFLEKVEGIIKIDERKLMNRHAREISREKVGVSGLAKSLYAICNTDWRIDI